MKIKRSWGREWARPLGKIIIIGVFLLLASALINVRRIEGDDLEPIYRDGDLVLATRYNDAPFLQLRVRGFDD